MHAFKELSPQQFHAAFPEVSTEILSQLQAGLVPRLFRVAAATDPVVAGPEGLAQAQARGVSAAELYELSGMASLANFLATLVHGLTVQPEPEFLHIVAAARASVAPAD